MKKIKMIVLLFVIFLTSVFTVKAQYLTGIGVSVGWLNRGVTLIQYFAPKDRGAANFILGYYQSKGYEFAGFYEIHNPNHSERIELANVGFFAGLGGHARLIYPSVYNINSTKKFIFVAGVGLTAGVEWKLPHMPLLLSLNVRPFLDLTHLTYQFEKKTDFFDVALSLRYLF